MSKQIILLLIAASWIAATAVHEHTYIQLTVAAITLAAAVALYIFGAPLLFLFTGIGLSLLPTQTILLSMALDPVPAWEKIVYFICAFLVGWLTYIFASVIPLRIIEAQNALTNKRDEGIP